MACCCMDRRGRAWKKRRKEQTDHQRLFACRFSSVRLSQRECVRASLNHHQPPRFFCRHHQLHVPHRKPRQCQRRDDHSIFLLLNNTMFRSFAILVLLSVISCAGAFQVRPSVTRSLGAQSAHPSVALSSSSNDDNTSTPRRRKRVKRKESIASNNPVESTTSTPDLKPRDDSPVELQIKDVREVVSGTSFTPRQQTNEGSAQSSSSMNNASDSGGVDSDDSLAQLLADAKAMRKDVADSDDETEGDASIQESVRSILSTIVTIDFFVVCALLLWFLAGIFCSYILKNDAVQIAFNSIFQQVVQPALGILMIGSAASGTYQCILLFRQICFRRKLWILTFAFIRSE